jgi:hypothetical protein
MTRRTSTCELPSRHTVVVSDVESMFWKLTWNIHQFDQIQRTDPQVHEPLAYAAIDVCIAASSLCDWTAAAFVSKKRELGEQVTKADVTAQIDAAVPQQAMCRSIANTAKHSRFEEGDWAGGSVRIDSDPPSEEVPGGLFLRYVNNNGATTSIAANELQLLETNWYAALQTLGFTFPRTPPKWMQLHYQRIFNLAGID